MTSTDILARHGDEKLFRVDFLSHWSDIVAFDGETDSVKWYGPGYVSANKGFTYVAFSDPRRLVLQKHGVEHPRLDFRVGNGWILLIDDLIAKLVAAGWNKQLAQVKEKFGGLRFYIGQTSDELEKLIEDAESESFLICEECGNPGEGRATQGGWEYTSCDEHKRAR